MTRKKYQYTAESKERVSKERKNRIPWNKGLTKETDERVAKNAKATSIALKGHTTSENTRKLASERWKGKNNPAHDPDVINKRIQTRREKYPNWVPEDYIPWCTGLTKETDERILDISIKVSKALLGRPLDEYRKQKVIEFWSNPETRQLQSSTIKELWKDPNYRRMMEKAREGKYLSGETHPMKNPENRERLPHGETHWNWHGGVSFVDYFVGFNDNFKEMIRTKFGRKCALCEVSEISTNELLAVHHVNYDRTTICERYDWLFLPLCRSCHMKTGFNRYYWFNLLANQWAIHPDIMLDENILSLVNTNTLNYEYRSGIYFDKPIEINNECCLFYFVGDN